MLRDHLDEMIEMYAQGYSLGDIARHHGVSRQRVHQLIGDSYDQPHGGRLRQERYEGDLRAAHARILEGVSPLSDEAEQMGIKAGSLRETLKRHGLHLPPREPSPEHGTYYRYQQGCRCDECKAARKAYTREMQKREPRQHGTISAYRNYACRCAACRRAASIDNRLYREKVKRRNRERTPID